MSNMEEYFVSLQIEETHSLNWQEMQLRHAPGNKPRNTWVICVTHQEGWFQKEQSSGEREPEMVITSQKEVIARLDEILVFSN